jgi:hypothetical protein
LFSWAALENEPGLKLRACASQVVRREFSCTSSASLPAT